MCLDLSFLMPVEASAFLALVLRDLGFPVLLDTRHYSGPFHFSAGYGLRTTFPAANEVLITGFKMGSVGLLSQAGWR